MFYKPVVFLLILVFFFFGFTFQQKKNNWQLKKLESGIAVYTRTATDSKFKELKSIFQIKASLSTIVSLLNDYESYPQWVYRCGQSSTIKKISEKEFIHYQTVTAPWPVDSRDFVVDVKLTQDPITKIIVQQATCVPAYIPKVAGYVRITEFRAVWTLIPLKNGMVEIEYQLLVNPGGNIPAWLVNLAVVDGPYETALNMKSWLLKEKYQKAIVSFVKEPE
jgi:ribosome-associated toxin RatA of RatAB toxin-antitoxin module